MPWTSSLYNKPIPGVLTVPSVEPSSSMKSNDIFSRTSLWYFNTLPQFQMYITVRKKVANTSGSQPPSKTLERTAEKQISSINPNTSGKHKAINKLVCHIRSITSVTKEVVTNITPTSAMPAKTIQTAHYIRENQNQIRHHIKSLGSMKKGKQQAFTDDWPL